MGAELSRVFRAFTAVEARLVMVGLDAAGKTTILYKLKLAQVVSTVPTVGFNVESVQYRNLDLTVWDIGGQDKIRRLWRHYLEGCDAVIFVVDSADAARLDLARDELRSLADEPQLRDAKFLVFANKQDLPTRLRPERVVDVLALRNLRQEWFLVPACAVRGDGLCLGMDWLSRRLNDKAAPTKKPFFANLFNTRPSSR
mmetsp:Transcript_20841/g.65558  ORF Transcript_20841/g.65558 Transcript_20841/m.65558 type:complete len:199 (+) Transcript_20841:62-658(+)